MERLLGRRGHPAGPTGLEDGLGRCRLGDQPVTQIRWGLGYIKNVYGTPCNAWSLWQSRYPHWY